MSIGNVFEITCAAVLDFMVTCPAVILHAAPCRHAHQEKPAGAVSYLLSILEKKFAQSSEVQEKLLLPRAEDQLQWPLFLQRSQFTI